MVIVHFYDTAHNLISSFVFADLTSMQAPVPDGAASFIAAWVQDAEGEPAITQIHHPLGRRHHP